MPDGINFERAGTRYARHHGHITDGVVLMEDGTVLAVIEAAGLPHDLADVSFLNGRFALRASLLMNMADDDVQLVEHLVQHNTVPPSQASSARHRTAYGAELAADYEGTCLVGTMARTWLLTIAIVPRFQRLSWRRVMGLQPGKADQDYSHRAGPQRDRRVARLEDRVAACLTALAPYGARRLGTRVENGVVFSEIAEAHRLALYARWMPVPLVGTGPLGAAIYTDRIICGTAGFRVETPGAVDADKPHGVMLGFRVYPSPWRVGMFDGLLGTAHAPPLPFRWVMTNSYQFQNRTAASDKLAMRATHMDTAGDRAGSLRDELDDAMDAVARGTHVMGEHHWSLAVHADQLADLESNVAQARSRVTEAGAVVAAEDIATEAAVWAQMPGAPSHLRARAGSVSSVAFAALSSLHNHSGGDTEHHWGAPVTRYRNAGGTAFDLGWHVRDVGHHMRIGPAGSGKTLSLGFDIAMLDPLVGGTGGSQIVFDKDRGNEILVRALEGPYAVLRRGQPCCAPLRALDDTEANRSWLHDFLTSLAVLDGRGEPTPDEAARLATGIAFVMRLPVAMRSIAAVREFTGHADPLGLGARLERWCRGAHLGWAFDAEQDPIDFDAPVSGVDPTAILGDATVMPGLAAYLLFRAGQVMDGRRAILHADEFRAYLPADPRFARAFEDFALTGRKKNASLDIATQQPEHILDHAIGASLVAQCRTRLLYRNPDASEDAYRGRPDPTTGERTGGLGCSARVFRAVAHDMLAGPHSMVIERERVATLVRFDLSALPQHIAVLSGRESSVHILHEVIGEHGRDPAAWLPVFRRRVAERAA
jgi:type IV secretion system protein VirB4